MADKAKEWNMEGIAGCAEAHALIDTPITAHPADLDMIAGEKPWPLIARVAFITSTAAALWGLIHLAATRAH